NKESRCKLILYFFFLKNLNLVTLAPNIEKSSNQNSCSFHRQLENINRGIDDTKANIINALYSWYSLKLAIELKLTFTANKIIIIIGIVSTIPVSSSSCRTILWGYLPPE